MVSESCSRSYRSNELPRTRKFSAPDASPKQVTRKYEIRSGQRTVSVQHSVSAIQAAMDYVRSFGTGDEEITRVGVDTVAWRGARFVAVPAADEQ